MRNWRTQIQSVIECSGLIIQTERFRNGENKETNVISKLIQGLAKQISGSCQVLKNPLKVMEPGSGSGSGTGSGS